MSPGQFNGKNFGGLHTSDGKYQRSGPYSLNGYRFQRKSHREYSEGKQVFFIGRHKDFINCQGIIIPKDPKIKSSRSMIRVLLEDGRKTYFYKDNLRFL